MIYRSLVIAFTSMLLVTACGGSDDDSPAAPPASGETPAATATPTAAPTAAPTATPIPVPTNILANGNLSAGSDDDFSNWAKWNGSDNLTATTDGCSGRALQALSTGTASWNVQFVSDSLALVADTNYTASMWIKADGPDGIVQMSIGNDNPLYGNNETITEEWQQLTWTFTAAGPDHLQLNLGGSTVTYSIDDIALVEGDTALASTCPVDDPELLSNSGLEAGEGNEFTNWGKWNGAELLTATTTEHRSGSRGLVASPVGGNPWAVQFVSDEAATEVGTTYIASMWIKGTEAGGVVRFSTNTGDASGPQYGPDATIGTDWEQVTWSFTADHTATRLLLDLGQSDVTYYIDDISLME